MSLCNIEATASGCLRAAGDGTLFIDPGRPDAVQMLATLGGPGSGSWI